MTAQVEIAAETHDLCGEAPLWIEERGTLAWVDQGRSLVRELRAAEAKVIATGFAAGGMARTRNGSLLLAGSDGLARLTETGALDRLALGPLSQQGCLNDICAGPEGQLYAGIMALNADATSVCGPGALVRIHKSGNIEVIDRDVLLPNGMGFSPDQQWLYVVDSARRQVLAYPARQLGQPSLRRRVLITLSPQDGVPDGIAVDADGGIWLALWYAGQVVRLSAAGDIELRLRLPFPQVSSLAFGGADSRDLYITTAAAPWHSVFAPASWAESRVQGGSLLRLRTHVRGATLHRVLDIA